MHVCDYDLFQLGVFPLQHAGGAAASAVPRHTILLCAAELCMLWLLRVSACNGIAQPMHDMPRLSRQIWLQHHNSTALLQVHGNGREQTPRLPRLARGCCTA
eukprot:jgi/Ulvmu1/6757/UM030_0093.1